MELHTEKLLSVFSQYMHGVTHWILLTRLMLWLFMQKLFIIKILYNLFSETLLNPSTVKTTCHGFGSLQTTLHNYENSQTCCLPFVL